MILLDGRSLSQKILSDLKSKIYDLKSKIRLDIILVGDDPSSIKYTNLKQLKAQELGVDCQLHHLSAGTSQPDLINLIHQLNSDRVVTGFFIQLPLPPHLDKNLVLNSLAPAKDVDGLNPNSNFTPAVVLGIIKLLENYQTNFTGKNIVIINDSDLIGQPLKKILDSKKAYVILANDQTQSLSQVTREADILISATGVKNLINADYNKDGAIVVDVANGDVYFEAVKNKCSFITPTFGGIGPMTIACLFENLVKIAIDENSTL